MMAFQRCTDFYYKTINFKDMKNLIILKSENVLILEEATQVLLDHFERKDNLIDLKVIKKDYKRKYGIDFLLQFKDKQYEIDVHLINLFRFLRIKRDDYLLGGDSLNNSPDNSGNSGSREENKERISNGVIDENLIVFDDDQIENRTSFSFNLNAKQFVPSKESAIETKVLNSTQNDIDIDIDQGDTKLIVDRKFENGIVKSIDEIDKINSNGIATDEERPRRKREIVSNENELVKNIDKVNKKNSNGIATDEERPRRRREIVSNENELAKNIDEVDKKNSNGIATDKERPRRRREIVSNENDVKDYRRSSRTIEDVTNKIPIKTKIDEISNDTKPIQKDENVDTRTKPVTAGINQIGINFDVRNM